jgi:dipeptidyl aminopeptidase/acylaminoacyl peptidase
MLLGFKLKIALLAFTCVLFTTATSNKLSAAKPIHDLPLLDLAFDAREFVCDERFSISSDGQMIAYSVRQRPSNINLSERNLENGTPTTCVGSKIYITALDKKKTKEIGPSKGSNWRPVWSPVQNKLAFYSDADGKPELWIYDAVQDTCKKLSDLPIKAIVFSMDEPRWSPDAKTLYVPLQADSVKSSTNLKKNNSKAKVFSSIEQESSADDTNDDKLSLLMKEYNATLAAVDVATGAVHKLVSSDDSPHPGFLTLSPSGKWLSYLSTPKPTENPQLAEMELALVATHGKGTVQTIAKNLIAGEIDCYKWHPFQDVLVYVQDKKIYKVTFDERSPKEPQRLCKNISVDFIPDPLAFTQDGKALVVGAKPCNENYREKPQSIFVVPLEQGNPIELQLDNKYKYIDIIPANYNQIWQPESAKGCEKSITACLEDENSCETVFVRLYLDKAKTKKTLWKGAARIVNFASKGMKDEIFCLYEDMSTPQNVYRFSNNFSEKERISNIDPRMDGLVPITAKVFETVVPLYNGELKKVKTTILLPQGSEQKEHMPAIVLFYPGARVSTANKRFSGGGLVSIPNLVFLNRGYALILPDVVLGPDGIPGNPLQEIMDVLLPQIYRAIDLGFVDGLRLGIMGQSFGGYGTAGVISKTNLFRAAVAISGVYDLAGNYGYNDKYDSFFNQSWSEKGQLRMGLPPWNNALRYIENSPYYLADKIRTPFLLVHGEEDDTCKVEEAEKLFSALKRLQRDVKLVIYHGQGHVIEDWSRPEAIDASEKIVEFLDSHLK